MKPSTLILSLFSLFTAGCMAPAALTKPDQYIIQQAFFSIGDEIDANEFFQLGGANLSFNFWERGGHVSVLLDNTSDDILVFHVDSSFCTFNGSSFDFYDPTSEEVGYTSTNSTSRTTSTGTSNSKSNYSSKTKTIAQSRSLSESSSETTFGTAGKYTYGPGDVITRSTTKGETETTTRSNSSTQGLSLTETLINSVSITGASSTSNHRSYRKADPAKMMIPPNGSKSITKFRLMNQFFEELPSDRIGEITFSEKDSPLSISLYLTISSSDQETISGEFVFFISKLKNSFEVEDMGDLVFYNLEKYFSSDAQPSQTTSDAQPSQTTSDAQPSQTSKLFSLDTGDSVEVQLADGSFAAGVVKSVQRDNGTANVRFRDENGKAQTAFFFLKDIKKIK